MYVETGGPIPSHALFWDSAPLPYYPYRVSMFSGEGEDCDIVRFDASPGVLAWVPIRRDPSAMVQGDGHEGDYYYPDNYVHSTDFLLQTALDLQEAVDELVEEVKMRQLIAESMGYFSKDADADFPEGEIDHWDCWMTEAN